MLTPIPRQPEPRYFYSVGCMSGCNCSGGGKEPYPSLASVGCATPTEPTLPVSSRTWNTAATSPKGDWTRYMPWRAPGTAIPLDACGIASGFHPDAKIQYAHKFAAASNVKQGDKGSELPVGTITEWEAGATVTASWSLSVNHGGGYQYRVCPSTGTVDNACFEHNPLAFADGTQTVHFQAKGSKPVTIAAVDVSTGVQPAGAAWRRLPIPACACDLGAGCGGTYSGKGNGTASLKNDTTAYGESAAAHGSCTGGLQFEAPHLAKDWPEGYGYYVAELGKAEANPTSCAGAKSEETCGTVEDCTWYGPKSICYAAKAQGGKKRRLEETKKTNTCASHQSETPCTDGEGCKWYGPKNLCYSTNGADATDFSGQDAVVVDGEAQWWISDTLVAPTEHGSSGMMSAAVALSAVLAAMLMF
eukprot:gene17764-14543_t